MALIELTNQPNLELAPGIDARVVTAETFTVAHVHLKSGAVLPHHAHYHEQAVNVIEGRLELTVAGETHVLAPGRVMILPPNIPHSGRALTEVRVIDVFHPVREDFSGTSFVKYDER